MKFKIKQLTSNIKYKSGRNNSGKVIVRHRALGDNREVSIVNSLRKFYGINAGYKIHIVLLMFCRKFYTKLLIK